MIRNFTNCSMKEVALVGGKCGNLGELVREGQNVPPGFSITVNAYEKFIRESGVDAKIDKVISELIDSKEEDETMKLVKANEKIVQLLQESKIPHQVQEEIKLAYEELSAFCGSEEILVAVRSSTTMEDAKETSFAGQHETYLNVSGLEQILEKTMECWCSLFSVPALQYRQARKIGHLEAKMAVAVQKMVNSRVSGVIFTIDPITGDDSHVVIEAAWGLGEGIVSGYVTPDHIVLRKSNLKILEKNISPKQLEFARDSQTGETVTRTVSPGKQEICCLTEDELRLLADTALKIEQRYRRPQDIEWAYDDDLIFPNNLMILQSRPVTIAGGNKSFPLGFFGK